MGVKMKREAWAGEGDLGLTRIKVGPSNATQRGKVENSKGTLMEPWGLSVGWRRKDSDKELEKKGNPTDHREIEVKEDVSRRRELSGSNAVARCNLIKVGPCL